MILRHLLPASLALALCACTTDAPSAAAQKTSATPADPAPSAPVVADGSLDLHFTVREVNVNSRGDNTSAQCQLQFTATNNSQAPMTSMMAEFRITRASDGSVIAENDTLTMPFEIPPGETKEAWGASTVDSHRCNDIQIALKQPKYGMCRTKDKSPCPAYRLTGEGVAIVK